MTNISKMLTLIFATGILAVSSFAITPLSVNAQIQIPCIEFTKNGDPVGDPVCENQANDLRVEFRGQGKLQFTKNGNDVGGVQESPPSANDFRAAWDINGNITDFTWTRNGNDLPGPPPIPPGANDFKFIAGQIVKVVWTKDGRPIGDVPVPKSPPANDIRFFFKAF